MKFENENRIIYLFTAITATHIQIKQLRTKTRKQKP
jgi:hypothetical protein